MRWASGACALLLALVVMAGCASSGAYAPPGRYAANVRYVGYHPSRVVVVRNDSWNRVTVYLLNEAGATTRLGDVESMNQATFAIGEVADDGAAMHFLAHPLAGTSFSSEQFLFPSGGTAVWTIENHAALSNVVVR